MASVIDEATKALQQRLQEIATERKRLDAALRALPLDDVQTSAQSKTRGRRRRAPRGKRRAQVMESLRASPGLRPRDLANKHGIGAAQVSKLLRDLVHAGEAEKRKDGRYYSKG